MLEGRRAGRSCKLQETSLGIVLGMNNTITTKRVQCSELALDDTHQKEGSTKKGSSLNKSCGNGTVNWSRDRLSRRPVNKVHLALPLIAVCYSTSGPPFFTK